YRSPKAYQLNDYFNDLFATVWKPIDATQELKALSRRSLQRLYVDNFNSLLNPTEKEKEGANAVFYKSDLPLFVAQHLDKVEAYVKTQAASATGVNAMHYKDLLQQIKLIRERRVTVK
ncbi:MAG: zinc-dependent metalloprotease, partial [Prevotella sp.]|nr:zinc-dependent metalloprotease [Prevotella sp.]